LDKKVLDENVRLVPTKFQVSWTSWGTVSFSRKFLSNGVVKFYPNRGQNIIVHKTLYLIFNFTY